MRYILVLTLGIGTAASAAHAATDSTQPAAARPVVAEDGQNDLLMHPGRDTQGAARLGSVEINNPPHESFGAWQKPSGPDQADIRVGPTGEPAVSGPQAKANAQAVHQDRAEAVAADPAAVQGVPPQAPAVVMPTPQQAAAQAANAQAAGVTAAVSSAKTSAAAAQSGEGQPASDQARPEDSSQGAPDGSAPGGRDELTPETK